MNHQAQTLKTRTKRFALDVLAFVDTLPYRRSSAYIADQMGRAACSVASNYRAACRARSKAEFAAKIGVVLEEADESLFWFEIADARTLGDVRQRRRLTDEAEQLTAIFAKSSITVRLNLRTV